MSVIIPFPSEIFLHVELVIMVYNIPVTCSGHLSGRRKAP